MDADLIIKDFRRGASVIVKLLSDSFLIRGGGFEVASCGVAGRISKELLPKTLGVGGRNCLHLLQYDLNSDMKKLTDNIKTRNY